MSKTSKSSDKALLGIIRQAHGLSMYELGRRMNWKIGHVDGAVRRLLNAQRIVVRTIDRNGRKTHLVYPRHITSPSVVEVPKKLLTVGNPAWQKEAFVYALGSNAIGISGKENKEWGSFAGFNRKVESIEKKDILHIQLPQKFFDFYNLETKHIVKTINGNNILLTIGGDIIQTKDYPS
jgi:hypothetical protein